jgi:hypothetical protein
MFVLDGLPENGIKVLAVGTPPKNGTETPDEDDVEEED